MTLIFCSKEGSQLIYSDPEETSGDFRRAGKSMKIDLSGQSAEGSTEVQTVGCLRCLNGPVKSNQSTKGC